MMRTRLGALLVLTGVAAYAVPRSPQAALRSPLALRRGAAARRGPRAGAAAADGERPARGGADASGPSLGELRNFALPALGLWISGPLLTLIDTSAVGLCSPAAESALEIAALGPGGSVCDGASYAFAFLNIATTNLYASATSDGERAYVVRRGARLAAACGVAGLVATRLAAAPFLAFFIGSSGAGAAEIQARAAGYVRVRALGLPFLLVGNALTAALLGSKDAVSPLVAMAASAAVNVAGDVLAVGVLGRGVRGAAEATALAQAASCGVLAVQAARTLGRGAAGPAAYARDLLFGPPGARKPNGRGFGTFAGPVLLLVASKLASFGVLTHGAARLGAVPLASHQLAFTLYLLASLVLDAMAGQTAQAFLPPLLAADGDAPAAAGLARTLARLAGLSAGFVAAAALGLAARGARLFSPDAAVGATLATLAAPLAASVAVHGAVAHGEGLLLASADLAFVGLAYLASGLLFPPAVYAAVRRGAIATPRGLWQAFVAFQVARAAVFQARARVVLARATAADN